MAGPRVSGSRGCRARARARSRCRARRSSGRSRRRRGRRLRRACGGVCIASSSRCRISSTRVRIGAVDDELHALLGEVVGDLVELGLEGEEAVAAGGVSEPDEPLDLRALLERRGGERGLVAGDDLLHPLHAERAHRRADGAAADDDDRRGAMSIIGVTPSIIAPMRIRTTPTMMPMSAPAFMPSNRRPAGELHSSSNKLDR